jgi:hypothetical protein
MIGDNTVNDVALTTRDGGLTGRAEMLIRFVGDALQSAAETRR